MVRAKFKVVNKIQNEAGFEVNLEPVTSGSKENEAFYHYTPYGKLQLGTVNPVVADELQVGKQYYIDIEEAEKPGQ